MEIFEIAEMLGANINYESLLQTFLALSQQMVDF